ncbi:MAG: hypothetical protein LBV44_02955 [Methylobacillus sp.]|nr:hypothetical protein [Methylobacillus sp.]
MTLAINKLKKKQMSGLSGIAGAFFLYVLIRSALHEKISIPLFLLLLAILILTRYFYYRLGKYFANR